MLSYRYVSAEDRNILISSFRISPASWIWSLPAFGKTEVLYMCPMIY